MRPQSYLATLIPLILLTGVGPVVGQYSPGQGRIWIGPPADPERYYRFATDNGIPGTGRYAYTDYNWPSLREALDQYGLFGRRFRQQNQDTRNDAGTPRDASVSSAASSAVLRVLLPADAELWVADQATSSRGVERQFVTPPLEPGCHYSGEIRVRWLENGREIVRRQALTVHAGDRRTVDFRTPSDDPLLLNPPRKLGVPK